MMSRAAISGSKLMYVHELNEHFVRVRRSVLRSSLASLVKFKDVFE